MGGPAAASIGGGPRYGGAPAAARIGGGGNWAGGRSAWNGGNWNGGNWRGRGFDHRRRFFPGAVIGGDSFAYYDGPDYYGPDYYSDNSYYDAGPEVAVVQGGGDASYCAQRYKSWDPASGTYLGYDGQRHPCP
jgi:hypothetical protein